MRIFHFILVALLLSSCAGHRENIMFSVKEGHINNLEHAIWQAEQEYKIQSGDLLEINVFNKAGEMLIDPSFESATTPAESKPQNEYRVDSRGQVNLPMIGWVMIKDLTLTEASEFIAEKFVSKYASPYVTLKYLSKKAFVLGSPGGLIIPLDNPNTSLAEIITMAGGIDINGRADNIRILRGDQVIVANLSSFEGYMESNMPIQPNDIVYIEPVRRPFVESLREYNPLIGFITGLVSISALIISTR